MVGNVKDLIAKVVSHPSAQDASMKVLVSPEEGWEGYVMRVVSVEVDGFTPKHSHPWPHINYMLEGEGVLLIDGVEHPVCKGSYAYVPAMKVHQFRNAGTTEFQFICIVPEEGHK